MISPRVQLNVYCVIFVGLLIMVSCLIATLTWLFMLSPMLIGQVTKTASNPLVPIWYTLVAIPSPRVPKSNVQLHAHLLKLNITRLLWLPQKFDGYAHFLLNLVMLFLNNLWSTVIMLVPPTYVPILFFIHPRSYCFRLSLHSWASSE